MLKQVQHDKVEEISHIEPDFKGSWRDIPEKAVDMSPNAYAVQNASVIPNLFRNLKINTMK